MTLTASADIVRPSVSNQPLSQEELRKMTKVTWLLWDGILSESRQLFPAAPFGCGGPDSSCPNDDVRPFGRSHSPPSPDEPWSSPGLDKYETELARRNSRSQRPVETIEINPNKPIHRT